jgi:hypothetical protein
MTYQYAVGDRVRCISREHDAPTGIVGTVIATPNGDLFWYLVRWDPGQSVMMDVIFPDGVTPEGPDEIELTD